MKIGAKELRRRTGATYRQIDYWSRAWIIPTFGERFPQTGHVRWFDEDIVDKVKLLVKISRALYSKSTYSQNLLQKIGENYDKGFFDLGDGVTLNWRTNMVASREPRAIVGLDYEKIIDSIDWSRVIIETMGEHGRTHPDHPGQLCGACLKCVLLRRD